jgi:hypothetical protein
LSEKSFVLRALKILGLEEILKLSELLKRNQGSLKKVVPTETSQEDASYEGASRPLEKGLSEVLIFPTKHQGPNSDLIPEGEGHKSQLTDEINDKLTDESELFLLQHEYSKLHEGTVQRLDALREYQKIAQTYQVQQKSDDGKSVRKIISTNGILINKKQA